MENKTYLSFHSKWYAITAMVLIVVASISIVINMINIIENQKKTDTLTPEMKNFFSYRITWLLYEMELGGVDEISYYNNQKIYTLIKSELMIQNSSGVFLLERSSGAVADDDGYGQPLKLRVNNTGTFTIKPDKLLDSLNVTLKHKKYAYLEWKS